MIKAEISGKVLGITFRHPTDLSAVPLSEFNPDGPTHRKRRRSVCEIFELIGDAAKPTAALLTMGEVKCHFKDNFKKSTGRKEALTRALKSLKLSKEDRQKIWEAYLNRGVDNTVLELESVMRSRIH